MKPKRARARQWSRAAFGMAVLFGSLPVVSRILFGSWDFEEAGGIACVCLMLGVYWHVVARRYRTLPDPATRIKEAIGEARAGRVEDAIRLLSEEIRLSPGLWQAYQYRGELHLLAGRGEAALRDFETAIRLAPQEEFLRDLRERAAGYENL